MHNLHLVITHAEDAESACSDVENFILDFGNDNNWRTIEGCISEDNEKYVIEEGFIDSYNSIDDINIAVTKWVKYYLNNGEKGFENIKKYESFNDLIRSSIKDVWHLSKNFESLFQVLEFINNNNIKDTVDIKTLTSGLYEYQYDEVGITLTNFHKTDKSKMFIVFVNMHS